MVWINMGTLPYSEPMNGRMRTGMRFSRWSSFGRIMVMVVTLSLCCLGFLACSGPLVGVTVIDERTALENQVLGSYEELEEEVLLVASVRYIDPSGKLRKTTPLPPGKKAAIRALQRSSFNKDDIERYKERQVLGENISGGLTLVFPDKLEEAERPFVENLLQEENADRELLMWRVIETNETLTDEDFPKVKKTFAALHRDQARRGDMIQLESGEWVQKP